MKNNYNKIQNESYFVFQKWSEDPTSLSIKELKLLTSSAQKLISFNVTKIKGLSSEIEQLKSIRDKSNNLYKNLLKQK